jgi:hypothetical protein
MASVQLSEAHRDEIHTASTGRDDIPPSTLRDRDGETDRAFVVRCPRRLVNQRF